jgi:L-ribulose-5-phosphate 4-epimerase
MESLKCLREEVLEANLGICRAGLVTMHSGNASGIDRATGCVVIKPSGMDYERISPELLAVLIWTGGESRPATPETP